ncbi:NAD(P)-binding domain-containing protein [Glycomyces sp. A-F 0318]|uniref:flavin-containing monooxygenase n=1 Tax=Glycomyces amatae TaxID=2881355 RepID=UPI001E4447D4|nr:NAD(P)-binding domain-containing protein [Glycomyces amatae]MCD0444501.1 NAD(P)-binding domain-containing protein [Glycomyces amatae]
MQEYSSQAAYDRGEAVCVIGAGASGLIAVKNLRENGFEVDCYERDTVLGGLWNPQNQHSPLYPNTHLVTSRSQTEIPDFPMPDDWPDYPSATQMLTYLTSYAKHFGLSEHIWYGSEIAAVEPVEGSRFEVIVKPAAGNAARRLRYAAVIIATGHHWAPNLPSYPGQDQYRGTVLHSSQLKDASRLRGKHVLVVGGGNSGVDLACEAAVNAAGCVHSVRRDTWHLPKYLGGEPADYALNRLGARPKFLRRFLTDRLLNGPARLAARMGIEVPGRGPGGEEPVRNGRYLEHVGDGSIRRRGEVARFDGYDVAFADGTEMRPDLVVFATGYRPQITCVAAPLLGVEGTGGTPQLMARMFSPKSQTLAVAGLVEPGVGVLPIVHWQTHAIARWLQVRKSDPERAKNFRDQVQSETTGQADGPGAASPRHRLAVDAEEYLASLARIIDTLEQEPAK